MTQEKIYDTKGDHAFADILNGPAFSGDWEAFCRDAIKAARINIVAEKLHRFSDGSLTFMAVLAESSFIATLSTDRRNVRVDCYTCGDEGQPMPAVQHVCGAFNGAAMHVEQIVRGVLPENEVTCSKLLKNIDNEMVISDVVYGSPISDRDAADLLEKSIHKKLGHDDVVTLSHYFEPNGLTMVFAYQGGHGDMHTYPEHNYLSQTAVGPCHIPFNLLAEARPTYLGTPRGNILIYPRQDMCLRLAA